MNEEYIAKVAHQVNKVYCESIGDKSQVNWEDAPDWQKNSIINGVKLHIDNPDTTAEGSHESWLFEKRRTGWTHGVVKSDTKKTHPCMCAYADLPVEQRTKDHLFKAIVTSLSVEH